MLQAYGYAIHLLAGFALLAVFFRMYTRVTPFDEVSLIRKGNVAAVLSLAGALIGFSLTLAASIVINATFLMFLAWAAGAMVVQVACHAIIARALPDMDAAIADNNVAMGGLMGVLSLVVGIVNAACLS